MRRACRASGTRFESSKENPGNSFYVLPILHQRGSRKSVTSGAPWNGRCRSPGRGGAISRCMSGPTSAYIVVIVAMIAASPGAHAVAGAPTAVIVAVGRVIGAVVSNAAFNADTSYFTSTQQQRCHAETTCHQSSAEGFHFGSALVSLSLHSIKPNGAPAGSATTASIPPWRSTRGSTKTRPPMATTLAAVAAVFSTRTKFSQ